MEDSKEKIIYEYCLLRYVPDLERGEFLNVGLMMMSKRCRWMRTEILLDEVRLLAMSAKCNLERLREQISVFQSRDVPSPDIAIEEKYRWMAAVKSAIIQTSPSHPGLLYASLDDAKKSLDTKFDELFERLVK